MDHWETGTEVRNQGSYQKQWTTCIKSLQPELSEIHVLRLNSLSDRYEIVLLHKQMSQSKVVAVLLICISLVYFRRLIF